MVEPEGAGMTLKNSKAVLEEVTFNRLKAYRGPAIYSKGSEVGIGEVNFS